MSNITKYQKEFRKKLETLENILLQSNHPEIAKGNSDLFSSSLGGTKKVVHAVEDCLFINVHPNPLNNKNIDEIEKEVVVKNYKDYNKFLLIDK